MNGNHDGVGTDFFKPDFRNSVVKGKYGNKSAAYSDCESYYYVDYEKANTRLVILSLPCDSDTQSDMPAPVWKFGKEQLSWLKNIALDTDKYVVILSHVPFYYKYIGDESETLDVWDGECVKQSYTSALCGEIGAIDEAAEIIAEFNKRKDTGVVAVLSGHTHKKSVNLVH